MSRYTDTKAESIYSDELKTDVMGFVDVSNVTSYKSTATTGKVLKGMEYRPDKISAYYLGTSKYAWLISMLNNFTNGVQDYYLGRDLLIPTL
jgi:hypothetical protein